MSSNLVGIIRSMNKICKLDPQPGEAGVFATGYTRLENLDVDGRRVYDPDWDLKPKTGKKSVFGAWLGKIVDCGTFPTCIAEDRFSICPFEVSIEEWANIHVKKYFDGWWWVKDK